MIHTWFANPCNGPAKPAMDAENDRYGSDKAEPTRWHVWAETFPPSKKIKVIQTLTRCTGNKSYHDRCVSPNKD